MRTYRAYRAYHTTAPAVVRPPRAPHIDDIAVEERTSEEPRRATALGTPDEFSHILDGLGYTLCGQRLRAPATATHGVSAPPWCPKCPPVLSRLRPHRRHVSEQLAINFEATEGDDDLRDAVRRLVESDMSDAEREAVLADFLARYSDQERTVAALRAKPCVCDHPLVVVEEFGAGRCGLCGREPREAA